MSSKELVGTICQYGGEFIDLLEVSLNQEFWVCNGGYDAYVIEEEGKRYLIIPNAPADELVKQLITENRRYGLEVEMSSRKNVDARYTECDCCGKRVKLGDTVYRMNGTDYIYCSSKCLIDAHASVSKLTVEIADECCKGLHY